MITSRAGATPSVADRLSNSRVQQLYRLRLATTGSDVKAAQRLRFQVFNMELGEGLAHAYLNGLDADLFDDACDHLLVEEVSTGTLAGTYRLQTGPRARAAHGFYSAQEFDLEPLLAPKGRLEEMVELGRACVHRQHRNLVVLGLLWKGIATYAKERGGRYLIGCSSVNSQNPAEGIALYEALRQRVLAPAEWLTRPMPGFECRIDGAIPSLSQAVKPPKLMSAYFSIGAKICGPPALDSDFQTIDFLTLLDLEMLPASVASRYNL